MFDFKKYLSFMLCGMLVFFCGCGEKEIEPPTETPKDIIRIACVGDSLTQGIGAVGWQNGDFSGGYPNQLELILGDGYEVGNFGKGGSYVWLYDGRTENLWYPKTAAYSLSNQFNPDIVIIMLGTNDARVMKNEADSNAWKTEFTKIVEHYLDMKSKPEVYIMSGLTLELYDKAKDKQLTNYILPRQKEVANDLGCTFLDTYHDLYKEFTNRENLASDKLHPNNNGYKIIAEYVAKKLKLN